MAAGEGKLVDGHVHLAVQGERPEQGIVSRRMQRGLPGRLLRRVLGIDPGLPGAADAYLERLRRELGQSRWVGAAVALALDGVYHDNGRLDLDRTHLYVPNDHALAVARRCPELLAGASVNPLRRDALDELERVAAAGAVLVKWLPNAQLFDPADPAHRPFYRALERLRLPLLVHTGREHTVPAAAQHLGHPARLRPALDEGVAVIAAHAGTSGVPLWPGGRATFLDLLERHPNLLADSAALLLPGRGGMLARLAGRGLLHRLTFGSDYPLPVWPALWLGRLGPWRWAAVRRLGYFDRQVALFRALGWEPSSAPLAALAARREPPAPGGGPVRPSRPAS